MQSLEHEFEKRRPWVTKFYIQGRPYGGEYNLMDDVRIKQFFESFPRAQKIIELGSLEGAHAFSLAKHKGVQRVLGIEGRESNIEKCHFVQGLLKVSNVEFVLDNLEIMELSRLGKFDAVFCSGLLYHLPEPWKLLVRLPPISPNLFLWTHYAAEHQATEKINGFQGMRFQEQGLADPLSGMSPSSFWPNFTSLLEMLKQYGYRNICILEINTAHEHGPTVTLAATTRSLGRLGQLTWVFLHWRWKGLWWQMKIKRWLKTKVARNRMQ